MPVLTFSSVFLFLEVGVEDWMNYGSVTAKETICFWELNWSANMHKAFSELTIYTAVLWEWHKHSLFNLFAGLIDLITSKADKCCQRDSEMEIYYLMLWNMVVL